MFPIWIRDGKNIKPSEDTYYILAANGLFLRKKNSYWDAVVPVDRLSILEDQNIEMRLALPRIPAPIVHAAARFFEWVYQEHGAEAMTLLWLAEEGEYRISAPPQEISAGGLRYTIPDRAPGQTLIGTFHSHASGSAYHSPTDACDEKSLDGVHATFGDFGGYGQKNFSLSVQAVMNGTRFVVDPTTLMDGIRPEAQKDGGETKKAALPGNALSLAPARSDFKIFRSSYEKLFSLDADEKLVPAGYEPPSEWQSALTKMKRSWLFNDPIPAKKQASATAGAKTQPPPKEGVR